VISESVKRKPIELGMHWFPQGGGGADRYLHGLVCAMQSNGLQPKTIVFGKPDPSLSDVRILPMASLPARLWAIRKAAVAASAECSGRLIASHFALYALPVIDMLKRHSFVVHFHGPWAEESKAERASAVAVAVKHMVERQVYHAADRLITLSQAFADILVQDYAVEPSRVTVIPGGVDTSAFRGDEDRRAARSLLKWPQDRRIVLAVRRLRRRMGIELLIDAAALVRQRDPECLFLIAGVGDERPALERRIIDLQLQDHVRLIGFVPDAELASAYRAADCTVMPSIALEGFGLAAVESLAAGTPCLGTPVGGLPEALMPLDPRLVFRDVSVEAIAQGLLDWFASPTVTRDQCQTYARERFDWNVVLPKVLAVYDEAIATHTMLK